MTVASAFGQSEPNVSGAGSEARRQVDSIGHDPGRELLPRLLWGLVLLTSAFQQVSPARLYRSRQQ